MGIGIEVKPQARAESRRQTYLCAAIGTPLDRDENLHVDGLLAHLQDQAQARVDGVLIGGTMGTMPLLTNRTYEQLVRVGVEEWIRYGEVLVGVGDLSFARTRERIHFVNELRIDGAVVLTPFFLPYSQSELAQYFEAVAAESRAPIYLYDLPQRTGVVLEVETVLRLAEHPNIAGIKCSGDMGQVRRLIDAVEGSSFRVIVAQAPLIDVLLRAGIGEHVDGIYCILPRLARGIFDAAAQGDWGLSTKRS